MSRRPPKARRVSATRRSQSAARRTSARTKIAVPPTAAMTAATFRPRASSRPETATLAPSWAKRRAAASPRPEVAPVMMATRSLSFIVGILTASPHRRPLLEEGVHAFGGVFEEDALRHRLSGGGVGIGQRPVDLVVESALAAPDHSGTLREDVVDEALDRRVERLGRRDPIDQA